ncbi:MAG: PLP-dependent transferase [Betaproteobacteria bacterium]|nr:PLP-dependent transferase [Betaproteobacteria bacterium]
MKKDTKLTQLSRKPVNDPPTVNIPLHRARPPCCSIDGAAARNPARWEADEEVPTYGLVTMPQALALRERGGGTGRRLSRHDLFERACGRWRRIAGVRETGDHVLMPDSSYYPGRRFAEKFLTLSVSRRILRSVDRCCGIRTLLKPNTTVVYAESPGSHTFEVQDIPAIARLHEHGARVIMDNAWATGYFFDAFEHGVDLVVQPAPNTTRRILTC